MILALSTTGALELTAYATLVLALVTGGLAAGTFLSVKLGKDALAQTQEDIKVNRQEVEEAHRPVVVGLADRRKLTSISTEMPADIPCTPYAHTDDGHLTVPIENIGAGPALAVEATISLRNDDGGPAGLGGASEAALAALRADGRLPLVFAIHGLRGGPAPGFELRMTYRDVSGQSWCTADVFVPNKGTYRGPTITRA